MPRPCHLSLILSLLLAFSSDAATFVPWGESATANLSGRRQLTNLTAITGRPDWGFGIRTDGLLISWGNPPNREFNFPTNIIDAAKIDFSHRSLILRSNGSVLHYGTFAPLQQPVPASLTNAIDIAQTWQFAVAVTRAGNLVKWGVEEWPPPTVSDAAAVAAGTYHGLVLRSNGTVMAWGQNDGGQCNVPAGLSNVIQIAGGYRHSAALLGNGNVVVWGTNEFGQLNKPTSVTNVVSIAAGSTHTMALRGDGSIICWGNDFVGQNQVPSRYSNWVGIAAYVNTSYGQTRMPVLASEPVSTNLIAGRHLFLEAAVVSEEPASIQWFFDNAPIAGAIQQQFVISNVQAAASGNYFVVASNRFGVIQSTNATVQVSNTAPILLSGPSSTNVALGSPLRLAISAYGTEPLSYQWTFKGLPLAGETNATLVLGSASETNEGNYAVVYQNSLGQRITPEVTIQVQSPPSFPGSTTNLTILAGSNVLLRPTVQGDLPLRFQWKFRDTNLPGATNLSMVISEAQLEHAGEYSMIASNAYGQTTNLLYRLTVLESAPVILSQPVSRTYAEGGSAGLRVTLIGSAPLSYQWWFDGSPIPGATNPILRFQNFSGSQTGRYFLVISNALGQATSDWADLALGDPFPGQIDWPALRFIPVATNLPAPTSITHAGDGTDRLFITDQGGKIRIVQSNSLLPGIFLDISRIVQKGAETGLLGLAFPPGFATNQVFYVHYYSYQGYKLARYRVGTNANQADPASEQVLLSVHPILGNHQGGQIAFGPDGYLYASFGDGGWNSSGGDPFNLAQNTAELNGKIVRLDVSNIHSTNYTIPPGNPYIGQRGAAPEIWALGLRNSFKFSFDRQAGDLYISDVGHFGFEEINFQPASSRGGENYGWNIREGPVAYRQPPEADLSRLTEPVLSYNRTIGRSVTGGYVYRGPNQPRLNGRYFFADFLSRRIMGMVRSWTNWVSADLGTLPFNPSSFGENEAGQLYLAAYQGIYGSLWQMADSGQVALPILSPIGPIIGDDWVTVSNVSTRARLYFTTDGRVPTEADEEISSGATYRVSTGLTLKVRGFRDDLLPSEVASATYTLKVDRPVISVIGGMATNGAQFSIVSTTPNARIHYTWDNSIPTLSSPLYEGPMDVRFTQNITARAFRDGFTASDFVGANFPLFAATPPVLTPRPGPFTNQVSVNIHAPQSNAVIYYSTNGFPVTTNSLLYQGPIMVTGPMTIYARAYLANFAESASAGGEYSLALTPAPFFNPPAGAITNGTRVIISNPLQGAVIYYTTNGLTPDTNSAVYSEPLILSGPVNLKAITWHPGYAPSYPQLARYYHLSYDRTVVWTLAGGSIPGSRDGLGGTASFNAPRALCFDSNSMTLFVADTGNHLIRRVSLSGEVSTFAGGTNAGLVEGFRTEARFNSPGGIAVDRGGQVFVLEWNNNYRIRRIDSSGQVTTIGTSNFFPASAPGQLEIDAQTNLFAGLGSSFVKIDGGGNFLTLNPNFVPPIGVGIDQSNRIFVSNRYLVGYPGPGGVEIYAGITSEYADGPRMQSLFESIGDLVCSPSGEMFISELKRIRRLSTSGLVSTFAGSRQNGFLNGNGRNARFNAAGGLCLDPWGNVYVADTGNHRIRVVSLDLDEDEVPDFLESPESGYTSGVDDRLRDSDQDGYSNTEEFKAGTDPQQAGSQLRLNPNLIISNQTATIGWQSIPGKIYQLRVSTNFQTWEVLHARLMATNHSSTVLDTNQVLNQMRRAYRIYLVE